MGDDNDRAAGPPGDGALYRRLLRLARPYTKYLSVLLLLDLLDSLSVLLTPLPLKIAIDSVIGSRPLPGFLARVLPESVAGSATALLVVAVGLLLSIALFTNLQALIDALLRGYVGERLVLGFRSRLFRHAQRLSLSYHDTAGTADATYRIQKDAASLQDLLIDGALPLVTAVFTVVLLFAVTLWLDWQLGLVAVTVAPVLLFVSGRYKRRLRQQAREVKKLESGALAVVQEVLSVLRVVKAFGQEDRERDRFVSYSREGMRARLRLLLAEGGYGAVIRLTTALGTAAVLFIGVTHVRDGALTLGSLVLVLGYLAQLYDPLKTISRKAGGLQAHLASAERAFALLDQRPDVDDRPDARPVARAAGAIAFRNVSFGYGEGRPVLCGVSFAVESGTRLGIVGTTGAGKTTLLNLLMRFYDTDGGQILLDGLDLRAYRLADLRNQFALVLQDTVLFSASVAENIAYARPTATSEEIEAAARAACAHDFIARLPDGYDTLVGERGMCLSGGERQRIAIARAFLKDAPVLLLDEPTSAIDVQTEADILEAMEFLMRGRTSIIITHRLTPLSACDAVLVLEGGRLTAPTPEPAAL
ncbi:MAG TPA: ABC transporter ATP-binding protein [Gemmataceae bacterium]|nr:ABC transporter ATP-binding protein [Gemmataceae bacterium]